jgi:hypothetical protein
LTQTLVIIWYTLFGYHPDHLTARHAAEPWYDQKAELAFEDMLTKLRKTLVAERITPLPTNTATTNWPAPQPPHNYETQVA